MRIAFLTLLFPAGLLLGRGRHHCAGWLREPDPAKLSLEEMEVRVRIDNGLATVSVKQIFANHTPR